MELYQATMNKYQKDLEKIRADVQPLLSIRHLYRTRRIEYIVSVIGICAAPLLFCSVIGFSFCVGLYGWSPITLRIAILISLMLSAVLFAPITIARQRGTCAEYNYLLAGKTREEIHADDFKNYAERMINFTRAESYNQIIGGCKDKIKAIEEKDKLIKELSSEYNITPKCEERIVPKDISEELGALYKELDNSAYKLAICEFFKISFKPRWGEYIFNSMAFTMVILLLWDLPVFMSVATSNFSQNNIWIEMMISIGLPLCIGVFAPILWFLYKKHRNRALFITINTNLLNPTECYYDVKTTLEENIFEQKAKIANLIIESLG